MDMNKLMQRTTITLTLEDKEWLRKENYEKRTTTSRIVRELIAERKKQKIKNLFTTNRVETLQKELMQSFQIKDKAQLHAILMKHSYTLF